MKKNKTQEVREEDVLSPEDYSLILNQALFGTWLKPMTLEDFLARHNMDNSSELKTKEAQEPIVKNKL